MSTYTDIYTHTRRHTHTHACVCVFCLFLLKNKQTKLKNDVSNDCERREFTIYTTLGPCLHHRQGRCSVNGPAGS